MQDGDEFKFLRSANGANKESIQYIRFDYHLSLIVTADNSGEIAVWDYETSSFLAVLICHADDEFTGIEFLSPKPLLLVSNLSGVV